jgi:hypothetical protein
MTAATSVPEPVQKNASVIAGLPLALLESVRSQDHPGEVLEDENLTVSLPRRLGLSDVVFTQIRRYETAKESGRKVPLTELVDLLRLVLRRPDAPLILQETGRRMAADRFERVPAHMKRLGRILPGAFAVFPIRGGLRRLLHSITGGARVDIRRKPFMVSMPASPTGRLDTIACLLYTAAIEEFVKLYSGRDRRVAHERCTARGDGRCEWTVLDAPAAE